MHGEGVKQDDTQAFAWLCRSKDGRYGYYNLAQCYLRGIGTEKDMEKAVICLEKAVDCKCIPTSVPTGGPSAAPTQSPTAAPTETPGVQPTNKPSEV